MHSYSRITYSFKNSLHFGITMIYFVEFYLNINLSLEISSLFVLILHLGKAKSWREPVYTDVWRLINQNSPIFWKKKKKRLHETWRRSRYLKLQPFNGTHSSRRPSPVSFDCRLYGFNILGRFSAVFFLKLFKMRDAFNRLQTKCKALLTSFYLGSSHWINKLHNHLNNFLGANALVLSKTWCI